MLTEKSRRSDSIALPKRQLIAVRQLSGNGLALSVIAALAKAGLRLPASASLSLASCWPRPQQLLPVSAAGGGRRRCPQKGEAFCAFLLKKLPEDTFYWTFILLYFGQNKKTQEGRGMKDIELRYVGGHVEVYTGAGAFLFSADTLREAMEELDAA